MKIWPIRAKAGTEAREVFLWDLGGQEWYRLVHQLFLGQTKVAILLFDATRDRDQFDQVRVWNGYLLRQSEDPPRKLLVRTKVDEPGQAQPLEIESLCKEIRAAGYHEISVVRERGVETLWAAIQAEINWDATTRVTRFNEFQRVRDQIQAKTDAGETALYADSFAKELGEDAAVLDAVIRHCEHEGLLRNIRLASGDRVLFLRVDIADQYASSVIQLARLNPRGVPAISESDLGRADLVFPGMSLHDRLPRLAERQALECVCQMLVEHGVCFRHQGLLIFPDLFPILSDGSSEEPGQRVSLYYDFTGPLGNIYSSLVVTLGLSGRFGRVRLQRNNAVFEADGVRYGVKRDVRKGGRGHLDLLFSEGAQRELFVLFVEDHLQEHGIVISEGREFRCGGLKKDGTTCDRSIAESDIRGRLEDGNADISCPLCETRHSLTRSADDTRHRRPDLAQQVVALRSEVKQSMQRAARESQRVVANAADLPVLASRPTRILHLTDLHLKPSSIISPLVEPLMADLEDLKMQDLDFIVISGDLVHQGDGFEKAREFLTTLRERSRLTPERFLIVPGNHDLDRSAGRYFSVDKPRDEEDSRFFKANDDLWLQREEGTYAKRFERYRTMIADFRALNDFDEILEKQHYTLPFPEHGLQFLLLNSAWEIDRHYKKRASLNQSALHSALAKCQAGLVPIAIWHHAVTGDDKIKGEAHISHLQKQRFRFVLHGDVHEPRTALLGHLDPHKSINVVGGGSFAADAIDRPPSVPQMYNLIEIEKDCTKARVYVRQREIEGGAFGFYPIQKTTHSGQGFYDIDLRD
jgi:hypothetical protein